MNALYHTTAHSIPHFCTLHTTLPHTAHRTTELPHTAHCTTTLLHYRTLHTTLPHTPHFTISLLHTTHCTTALPYTAHCTTAHFTPQYYTSVYRTPGYRTRYFCITAHSTTALAHYTAHHLSLTPANNWYGEWCSTSITQTGSGEIYQHSSLLWCGVWLAMVRCEWCQRTLPPPMPPLLYTQRGAGR